MPQLIAKPPEAAHRTSDLLVLLLSMSLISLADLVVLHVRALAVFCAKISGVRHPDFWY